MSARAKAFYFVLILSFFTLPSLSIANDEKEITPQLVELAKKLSEKKPKSMKNASWKTQEDKAKERKEKEDKLLEEEAFNESELGEEFNNSDSDQDKNLSPEDKLWKKYKSIADKAKSDKEKASKAKKGTKDSAELKNNKDTSKEALIPQDATEHAAQEQSEEKAEKASNGIMSILENYKNANKGKGKINSKSFGNSNK